MNEEGATSGRPQEVRIAAWLVLIESIVGVIIGGVEYVLYENELSLIGAVLAIIGFWIYLQILNQDLSWWNIAVIFNVLAIALYIAGWNIYGVGLSVLVFVYLILPSTR